MTELVFLLEEPSAQAMLEGILPRLLHLDRVAIRFIVFDGKQDLEKQLVRKLKGYLAPNAKFVVLRDKDACDCHAIKSELTAKCEEADKPEALVRIACHHLESWYLADLAAVEAGLELSGLTSRQGQAKFRAPDRLANAEQELGKLTRSSYQKIAGSRSISPHMRLDNTRSHSFAVFITGLRRLLVADDVLR